MTSPNDKVVPTGLNQAPKSPDAKTVDAFHKYDDLDASDRAHHHTIGPNGAAKQKHFHDGEDSPALLDGVIFTGIVGSYNPTTFRQMIAAMVKLGASDTTS